MEGYFIWIYLAVCIVYSIYATVMGTMFLLYGADMFHHFEAVFSGDEAYVYKRPIGLMWFAAMVSLVFPFLNALIEELMYRGYAQPIFIKHYKRMWIGILIPAIGFALQHTMLAATFHGMLVFGAAFFVWGVGSGIIYQKQKRLFPLIVCHFIVNIMFSIFPLIFLVMGFYE